MGYIKLIDGYDDDVDFCDVIFIAETHRKMDDYLNVPSHAIFLYLESIVDYRLGQNQDPNELVIQGCETLLEQVDQLRNKLNECIKKARKQEYKF
jgi:hypothetical protein